MHSNIGNVIGDPGNTIAKQTRRKSSARCMVALYAIASIAVLPIALVCLNPIWQRYQSILGKESGVELAGETDVSALAAEEIAELLKSEYAGVLGAAPSAWVSEPAVRRHPSLSVQSARVLGEMQPLGATVQRAYFVLCGCNVSAVFDTLVSPLGFGIIDPVTPLEEHTKLPLIAYDTSTIDGARSLEVRRSVVKLPLLSPREFISANLVLENVFISKSVLDTFSTTKQPCCRALNTFALVVSEGHAPNSCEFQSIDFASGIVPTELPLLSYYVNADLFYPQFVDRLLRADMGLTVCA